MKLAVISDIHGNLPAFQAVLRDLAREAPDRVIVAGDLVNRGPASREVLEIVADRGWEAIEGNHDQLMAEWMRGQLPDDWYTESWYAPLGWVAEQVADWLPYLEALPFELRVTVDGAPPMLIVHGSPRDNREGLQPYLGDAEIAEILAGTREPLVVCAHTHKSLDRTVNGHRVVNVGAVGKPFNKDTRAQYGLFTLRDGAWQVTLRAVAYDRQATCDAFASSGYLDAGVAAHIFLHELVQAESFLYRFEQWAEGHGLAKDLASWQAFLQTS